MSNLKIYFFYTSWCGPALRLKRLLSLLKPVRRVPLEIHYMDADKWPGLKSKHKVKLIPTTIFSSKGREVSRIEGAYHLNKYQDVLNGLR